MNKNNYNRSFLASLHIILGIIFTLFTFYIISNYTRNIIVGSSISMAVLILYLMLLKKSASLYNGENMGVAYFFTIGGFFVALFMQMSTCMNSITLNLH